MIPYNLSAHLFLRIFYPFGLFNSAPSRETPRYDEDQPVPVEPQPIRMVWTDDQLWWALLRWWNDDNDMRGPNQFATDLLRSGATEAQVERLFERYELTSVDQIQAEAEDYSDSRSNK